MQRLFVATAFSVALAVPAMACEAPDHASVDIPSGASASEAQIRAAQQTVASMVQELEAYTACIDAEIDSNRMPAAQRRIAMRDHDDAIDTAQRLATRMNREIRNYNRAAQLASQ